MTSGSTRTAYFGRGQPYRRSGCRDRGSDATPRRRTMRKRRDTPAASSASVAVAGAARPARLRSRVRHLAGTCLGIVLTWWNHPVPQRVRSEVEFFTATLSCCGSSCWAYGSMDLEEKVTSTLKHHYPIFRHPLHAYPQWHQNAVKTNLPPPARFRSRPASRQPKLTGRGVWATV